MSNKTPDEPVDILLVEDNPGDVRLAHEAFKSLESVIEFHIVSDGEEAVEYFDSHQSTESNPYPDLVLLDLSLPQMNGFTVLEKLDKELDYPSPPVLVLSSSQGEEDIAKSYENAANAYLTKPDDPTEFDSMAQAIEEFWLETARQPSSPS
ncbi:MULTISPECIES: response regulator [Natrialbaceae]|uniref:response regulator n=1 Tax=Natrialbaceae TaxID=1644061 RepID=UPI00207C9E07|nr:response regulator [Natronococcus sp. CG52]